MSRTYHTADDYTREHLAHSARTRRQRRHTPEADLTKTQELPAMPLALPAKHWPDHALERLARDLGCCDAD
jgi:hypothetical protein